VTPKCGSDKILVSDSELLRLRLDTDKLFFVCSFIVIFLIYVFWAGLLPVIQTGTIEVVQMKPRHQLAFFINSVLAFMFCPLILSYALLRSGTIAFYPECIVFYRAIGGQRSLKYSSMSVTQKAGSILICDFEKLQNANWFKALWIEWRYGMCVPLNSLLINKNDQQKGIDMLKKNARSFNDMRE